MIPKCLCIFKVYIYNDENISVYYNYYNNYYEDRHWNLYCSHLFPFHNIEGKCILLITTKMKERTGRYSNSLQMCTSKVFNNDAEYSVIIFPSPYT
jgi:hypothetical protein